MFADATFQDLHSLLYIEMEESISNIVAGCRKGKQKAQLQLYNLFAKRLYAACFRIIGKSSEAEEAMQDTFLKIFGRLDQYKPGQCFEAWMHRIAVNTAIDYVRRNEPDFESLPEQFAPVEEEQADESEISFAVQQVKTACMDLPSGYRIILSLYLFEGYDMEEIASILQIQPASVRSQYLRAKRKLITQLATQKHHG